VGIVLGNAGGGGIEEWLNCAREGDWRGCWVGSNLTGGSEMREAIEGCELAGGGGFEDEGFASRAWLFSELYMTATFVEGEFMVPVRDHPMAVEVLASVFDMMPTLIAYLD
jgi:hypothetical protein